ncbi:DUF167 family protein [Polymorphum gilvum]|uniref:UPF0235 protein SL003B_0257 n=1 Tax=Polymorphum gilvum (strain LMG 25793 / CGMCC 1.9160 / SL003B-26A1) TaxID=991905 RepID=F2J149_POLGS|nr:DUF167 family protein [Polymorphum gilvum]ADZ68695.1 hypothetical protein SL003B_0257 [Polymorphum gilvum SL003B-26A1]
MAGAARPWRAVPGGLAVDVRLTPRAGKDAVEGCSELSDGRPVVLARVRAIPEKGAANAALEALIAKALGVPKSAVAIDAGAGARLKTLKVSGDAAALAAALEALTG